MTLRQTNDAAELRVQDTGTGIPGRGDAEVVRTFSPDRKCPGTHARGERNWTGASPRSGEATWRKSDGRKPAGIRDNLRRSPAARLMHLPADQIGGKRTSSSMTDGATPFVQEVLRWLPDESREGRPEVAEQREAITQFWGDHAKDDDRPRVLVADDNADMREYVARLLAEQFRVQVVSDGKAALAAARENGCRIWS